MLAAHNGQNPYCQNTIVNVLKMQNQELVHDNLALTD